MYKWQNLTKWNDKDLKLLFLKCFQEVRKEYRELNINFLDIIFQETIKTKYAYGLAYPIGFNKYIRIHLPCCWYRTKITNNIKKKLIELLIHECYHIGGILDEKLTQEKAMSHNLKWSENFNLYLDNKITH